MQPSPASSYSEIRWFVLRDLKRSNAKNPAFKYLPSLGIEIFTPMHWVVRDTPGGGTARLHIPFIPSLLFARTSRRQLDPVVEDTPTLQYRYVKGAPQNTPMVVPAEEMSRFMEAVAATPGCLYYTPEEITPDMIGKDVIIKGGPLDGHTGRLLKMRGSKKKRLLVELRGIIIAAVEVTPEYIQLA